ncbi:hypothetical protein GQ457_08G008560 [Hibiscus cannabinus]
MTIFFYEERAISGQNHLSSCNNTQNFLVLREQLIAVLLRLRCERGILISDKLKWTGANNIIEMDTAKLSYASSNCLVADKAVHGARFGFSLDEELKKSAACDDVKTALAAEISREALGLKYARHLEWIQKWLKVLVTEKTCSTTAPLLEFGHRLLLYLSVVELTLAIATFVLASTPRCVDL